MSIHNQKEIIKGGRTYEGATLLSEQGELGAIPLRSPGSRVLNVDFAPIVV